GTDGKKSRVHDNSFCLISSFKSIPRLHQRSLVLEYTQSEPPHSLVKVGVCLPASYSWLVKSPVGRAARPTTLLRGSRVRSPHRAVPLSDALLATGLFLRNTWRP